MDPLLTTLFSLTYQIELYTIFILVFSYGNMIVFYYENT